MVIVSVIMFKNVINLVTPSLVIMWLILGYFETIFLEIPKYSLMFFLIRECCHHIHHGDPDHPLNGNLMSRKFTKPKPINNEEEVINA